MVRSLFALAAAHTSASTSIVFDDVFRDMVDGDDRYRGAAQTRRRAARLGEPFLFGIPAGTVDESWPGTD